MGASHLLNNKCFLPLLGCIMLFFPCYIIGAPDDTLLYNTM